MKIACTYDTSGYITAVSRFPTSKDTTEDIPEDALDSIILGLTKIVDGVIVYRCTLSVDDDGYIVGAGTAPDGDTDVYADELRALVPGAAKLTDGHLVVDADKLAEIQADLAKPVPTAEQQMIANLTLELAQLKAGGAS